MTAQTEAALLREIQVLRGIIVAAGVSTAPHPCSAFRELVGYSRSTCFGVNPEEVEAIAAALASVNAK